MRLLKVSCKLFVLLLLASFITSCTGEFEEEAEDAYLAQSQQNSLGLLASNRSSDDMESDSTYTEDELGDDVADCLDLVYPVDILFPDGHTETANSDIDLEAIYDGWEEMSDDSTGYPTLVLPISVVLDSGETISVMTEEELLGLLAGCMDEEDEDGEEDEGQDDEEEEDEDEEEEEYEEEEDDDDEDEEDDEEDDDDETDGGN